jgi:hypothetical protein
MKPVAHFPLNDLHCSISESPRRCAVEGDLYRKGAVVLPDDLDAADRFAAGPLPNSLEAFFAEVRVGQTSGWWFWHWDNPAR